MSAPLPRSVRGKRPAFHEQAATDRLIAMVLALTSEVSVLRDRVATLEALTAGRDAVDGFMPDLDERKRREAEREAYLGRVLHIMREEIADIEGDETSDAYWREISDIEEGAA